MFFHCINKRSNGIVSEKNGGICWAFGAAYFCSSCLWDSDRFSASQHFCWWGEPQVTPPLTTCWKIVFRCLPLRLYDAGSHIAWNAVCIRDRAGSQPSLWGKGWWERGVLAQLLQISSWQRFFLGLGHRWLDGLWDNVWSHDKEEKSYTPLLFSLAMVSPTRSLICIVLHIFLCQSFWHFLHVICHLLFLYIYIFSDSVPNNVGLLNLCIKGSINVNQANKVRQQTLEHPCELIGRELESLYLIYPMGNDQVAMAKGSSLNWQVNKLVSFWRFDILSFNYLETCTL